MRELWLKIHRWLGLGIGLFFGIAALTGALIVYENELDALLNGSAYRTTPGDVGAEAVLARAAAEGSVVELRWPQPRLPVYAADVLGRDGAARTIMIDPGSGDVTVAARRNLPVFRVIRRMHTNLLVGRPGHYVVLGASILALFSMATGLILWWPGVRRLLRGLAVRTRRGFYPFNFDLHQAAGALALPLLFVITLSGVLISYENDFERVVRRLAGSSSGVRSWDAVAVRDSSGLPGVQPYQLIRSASATVGDAAPVRLRMPAAPGRPAVVQLLRGRRGKGGGIVDVIVDPLDATVLQVRDPRQLDLAQRVAGPLNYSLHVGGIGGPVVRFLYLLACLVGAGLVVTGSLIWWLKRSRIETVEERKSTYVLGGRV